MNATTACGTPTPCTTGPTLRTLRVAAQPRQVRQRPQESDLVYARVSNQERTQLLHQMLRPPLTRFGAASDEREGDVDEWAHHRR